MTALTKATLVQQLSDSPTITKLSLPAKAATKLFQGGLVVCDAGYAAPGRTATGLIAAGVLVTDTVDNTAGAAGAKQVDVRRGVFKFANSSAGDLIVQADVLKDCYIVDDATVAKTDGTGTRSKAGRIISIDAADGGVFVAVGTND